MRAAGTVCLGAAAAAGVLAWQGAHRADDVAPSHRLAPPLVTVAVGHGPSAEVATGFVAGGGRVVTVAHVLDGANDVTVSMTAPQSKHARSRGASVVRVDRRLDLAVLRVRGLRGSPVRPTTALGGAHLLVRGTSGPVARTVRVRRRVTATVRMPATGSIVRRPVLELAASVEPGDSGSPIVGSGGRVIGVVFASSADAPDTAWAVDGEALDSLLGR